MRLPLLVLLALVATAETYAADASPRPSDTNNQPANATTKPPAANTPPPPGATTPNPATPAPAPSTPAPTTAAPPTTAPPSTTAPPPVASTAAPSPTPTPSPEPTPPPPPAAATDTTNASSSDAKSSGMGAGAIVGIVLACVGLVGIIGFFAYRHFRARREDEQHGYDVEYGGASPVLESSRAHDAKMYASFDMPKHSRQTTTATATPTDDIVIMTKFATPSSPKFADNPPQLSPPPSSFHHEAVADFTKSTHNFDQSRGPGAAVASTEFTHSYREGSYAESYAESYAGGTSYGGGSFMNSFDHGMLGRDTFRDTLTDEENATPVATAAKNKPAPTNGLAGLDSGKDDSHWMEAMDEMRDTNDSYAMLEAGGSYNSRGSAMRFSTESDIRG